MCELHTFEMGWRALDLTVLAFSVVLGLSWATQYIGSGFGYDPVFVPDGYTATFAEMTMDAKNQLSHRARALKKLEDYLKNHFPSR